LYIIDNKYTIIIMISVLITTNYFEENVLFILFCVFFSQLFILSILLVRYQYKLYNEKITHILDLETKILKIKNNTNNNKIVNYYEILYNEYTLYINNHKIIINDEYTIYLLGLLLENNEELSELFNKRNYLKESILHKTDIVNIIKIIGTLISFIITILVGLYIYDMTSTILLLTSIIVACSFMINSFVSQAFQSIVYIYNSNMEIGSFIIIKNEYYKVCNIYLYYTKLQQLNGTYVYMENIQLYKNDITILKEPLYNYILTIDINTPKLHLLQQEINKYSTDYIKNINLTVKSIENPLKMKLSIKIIYKYIDDITVFNEYITKDYIHIMNILQQLSISYSGVDTGTIILDNII